MDVTYAPTPSARASIALENNHNQEQQFRFAYLFDIVCFRKQLWNSYTN